MYLSVVALLGWSVFNSGAAKAQIYINEIVASNTSGITDEEGEYPDWIELYNYSDSTVSLQGYGISDDSLDLFKYEFPDVEIGPGEYYLIFASDKDQVGQTFTWQTVIEQGDSTKYIIPQSAVENSWITQEFDDSGWIGGDFGIGYGDGDDRTNVPAGTISVFTRTAFNITDIDQVNSVMLQVDFDDGYVAYLNGTEINRENISGESPLPFDATASDFTEPQLDQGLTLEEFIYNDIDGLISEGENVLAIQVHNYNSGSSDMTLIPFLRLGKGTDIIHLNFKLSSAGESLFLTAPDSIIIDQLTYPTLVSDESFGRAADNDSTWYIFTQPTPGEGNSSEGYSERLPEPELSLPGGFYQGTVQVSLTDSSLNDVVYFTADGSDPTLKSPRFADINPRNITATFTLKLRSIQEGKLPSKIVTETYFIDAEHNLPVVTISTHPDNLWSDETGIYVRGSNGIDAFCSDGPANWNQDWEIPIHIELYEKDGSKAFGSGAGAKIFGGCSRTNPAKSLSVYFRGEYGNAELNYKLFEEKDIDTFQAFVLRNSGNDFTTQNGTMIRDGLMTTLIEEEADLEYQAFRPAAVYLNGEYWGIHNIREKVNEHFIESNSEADSDHIDLLEGDGWEVHGSNEKWFEFLDALGAADMTDPIQYQTVENMIDIDNYIDYMAAQIYYANDDWPGNNIKFWRNQLTNGKWRWILYDTDFGFNLYGYNANQNTFDLTLDPNGSDWPNPPWSTFVFRNMVESDVFVRKFVNRMADLMNTTFKPEYINSVIDSLSGIIVDEIPQHQERWGRDVSSWESAIEDLRTFAVDRPAYMYTHMQSRFGLGLRRTTTVNVSNSAHGMVKVNRVIPKTYPWSGIYFSGTNIEVTAIPKPGYQFAGWSGKSESLSNKIEIEAGGTLTANFVEATGEEVTIVINEIMYNPSDENDTGDWIELYNASGYDIDISGWVIKDEDDTHEYSFPGGTEMQANSYLVVADDLTAFGEYYTETISVFGELGFGLAGGSDQVRLFDASGGLIDSLQYADEAPWPSGSDGTGYTLELKSQDLDNSKPESWGSSAATGGSPGQQNGITVSIEIPEESIPEKLALHQNYPNPFNPTTNINFELPKQVRVKLTIFDMIGREVAVLADEVYPAGSHQVSWNAEGNASGVYFYQIQVADQVFTKKMTLIK